MADWEHSSSEETNACSSEKKRRESKIEFSEDEEQLIIRMFNLVGERWSLIAGRIPGRTAEEIEQYWNSRHSTSQPLSSKVDSVVREPHYQTWDLGSRLIRPLAVVPQLNQKRRKSSQ